MDYLELFEKTNDWCSETFGPNRSIPALHHMKKEIDETIESIEKNTTPELEFADLFILLINSAGSYGITAQDLLDWTTQKLYINKRRVWGKPDEKGIIEHIKLPIK